MKNKTEVVSRLSSNRIGNSVEKTICPHRLLNLKLKFKLKLIN